MYVIAPARGYRFDDDAAMGVSYCPNTPSIESEEQTDVGKCFLSLNALGTHIIQRHPCCLHGAFYHPVHVFLSVQKLSLFLPICPPDLWLEEVACASSADAWFGDSDDRFNSAAADRSIS